MAQTHSRSARAARPRPPARAAVRRRAGRRRRLQLGAGTLALVAVALVAALSSGGGAGSSVTDPTHFDLPAMEGEGRVRLADFRGKPVVVNFFASWCTACEFELPGFTAVAEDLDGEVAFVGVNSLETGNGRAMAEEYGLAEAGFVLAKDAGGRQGSGLHDALGGRGMPITAFYDAEGNLVDFVGGARAEDDLRARLQRLYGITA